MKAQTNFCGSITKPVTVSRAIGNDNTPFKFYDRFGNIYTQDELRIYKNPNILSVREAFQEGIFILTFQDIETLNGRGFNDPTVVSPGLTLGAQRRDIVRQLFRELSDFLQTPNDNARVRINIRASGIFSGSGTLAVGSPVFLISQNIAGNIIDNEATNTINGGVDSYIGLDPSSITTTDLSHGFLDFNFPSGTDNDLYYDITNANVPTTKIDFYTVALHEAFHCLGFGTAMNQNGSASEFNFNYFRYDSFLRYLDNTTPPPNLLFYNSANNQVTYSSNGRTNALFKGCGANNGIAFKGLNLLNQDVHTPATWQPGSSLSHFECEPSCTTPQQNVMTSCISRGPNGVFRHPSQAEADALCDLGYRRKIPSTWGLNATNATIYKTYSNCSTPRCAYGVNDRFDSNGNPYEIIGNGSITINNILNNDQGTNLSITHLQIRAESGTGTLSNVTPTSFTFTPSNGYVGLVILSYVPACASNNTIRGNLTYITLRVRPLPCPTITQPTCGQGQNLVCYGDFESTRSHNLYSDFLPGTNNSNTTDVYERNSNGAFDTGKGFSWVSWNSCGTTFPFPLPNGVNNNRYLGIAGHITNKESATLPLQTLLDPNRTYRLSFEATARGWFDVDCNATSTLRILGANRAPCSPPEKTSMTPGTVLGCGFSPQLIRDVPINTTTTWTSYQVEFSGFAISQLLFAVPSSTYIFIDNVKLEEINCPVTCQSAGYTAIGTSATSVTNVSALVTAGTLPNTYTQTGTPREQLYVQGTLVVDRDYGFYDSRLKMAPGSRIVVNTGKLLDISQETVIEGCDQMWQGIQFQGGAAIYVTNSTIKDAEYAVRILRNNVGETRISLQGSNFLDNYYNLYVEPIGTFTSQISQFSHASNCMFGNPRGNLKLAYSGQANYDIKTHSGIIANDVPSMGIYDCSFISMDYGLLTGGSNFLLQRTKFSNMPRRVVPNSDDRGGFAISITGGSLFYYGFGANGTSAIDNADVGIRLISALFKVEDCNITNCNYGIRVNNARPWPDNLIKNNKLRVNQEAIRISHSGNGKVSIHNNDIAPNLATLVQGIIISENGLNNPSHDIRENIIRVNSTGNAYSSIAISILGQNSVGPTIITKNRIYLDGTNNISSAGIFVNYSGNLSIDNNYIEGIGQNVGLGMEVHNCIGWYGGSTFTCNGIDNVARGMLFVGNNMLDQGLKFNRFLHIKDVGLDIWPSGTIIGQQNNTGNQWEFGGYTEFAAINRSGNLPASLITTNTASNYFARNNISPSVGWFATSPVIPTENCTINLTTPVLQVRGAELTEEEVVNNPNSSYRTVAEGKNINQPEAIQNIANRQLLRFVEDKSKENKFALHGSFTDFNTKVKNKLDKNQYEWDKDFNAALTMDNALLSRFKENARLQEEAIKKAAVTAQRIADLAQRDKAAAAKMATTDNTLANLIKEWNTMEAEHSKKFERAKAKLRNDNKNNRGQKLHETHESYVNDVLLDLTEGKKMDKAQINQLDIIANLCPAVGGVAVYKARSVLGSLIDQIGTRNWNDRKNCDNAIANLRSNPIASIVPITNTPKVLAFPNPAQDLLKLSFYDTNVSSEIPHTIQIFNTMGGVLKHIDLKKLQDTDIDTKEIPTGVYILKLTAKNGAWSETIKISILR